MKVICIDNSKQPIAWRNKLLKKFVIYDAEEHPVVDSEYLIAIEGEKISYLKRRFTVIEEND